MPSMPGIMTSVTMMSGASTDVALSASVPFSARRIAGEPVDLPRRFRIRLIFGIALANGGQLFPSRSLDGVNRDSRFNSRISPGGFRSVLSNAEKGRARLPTLGKHCLVWASCMLI
jgi:hypothetical protein